MQHGYHAVKLAIDDPLLVMARKDNYVLEHRLVVARWLGRPLFWWEEVHHRNGNKLDNRLENLELWKRSQPIGVLERDYHCPGCRCAQAPRGRLRSSSQSGQLEFDIDR